jgi:hypothetical protein
MPPELRCDLRQPRHLVPPLRAPTTEACDYVRPVHAYKQSRIHHKRVINAWKPLLVFGKVTSRFPLTVWDVFQGHGVSKDHHDWEQGLDEAVHYLEALVPAGSLVVDPLMGSSTCGAAALRCGMRFQGCEIDTETFQQAKGRIAEETKGKNGR